MTLSLESLGATSRKKPLKQYERNGFIVTQLDKNRGSRTKRYSVCIIYPTLGWYPSASANFVFKSKNFDPAWLIKYAADESWNPSIWLHSKTGKYVLRVPIDRKQEVWKRLYRRGMCYNMNHHVWQRRRKRSIKRGYPSFVQYLEFAKRGEKLCHWKAENQKKLLVKILRKK